MAREYGYRKASDATWYYAGMVTGCGLDMGVLG